MYIYIYIYIYATISGHKLKQHIIIYVSLNWLYELLWDLIVSFKNG